MEDGKVKVTGIGSSGEHGTGWIDDTAYPTTIENGELVTDKIYEINVGETVTPNVIVKPNFNLNLEKPEDKVAKALTYESLDTTIATVSSDGKITGVSKGMTGIKITDENSGLEGTIYVIVGKREFKDIEKVVSGPEHTAMLKSDGTVWTWGNNAYGELGTRDIENNVFEKPQQVRGINGEGYLTNVIDLAVRRLLQCSTS